MSLTSPADQPLPNTDQVLPLRTAMAPTKSNPRRIVRADGAAEPPATPPKRNSERLASLRRKDDIVSKMAEIFDDVAPMESRSVVAVPVAVDDAVMPEVPGEPVPDPSTTTEV
ncbi:uncharacterized protein LOC119110112 [Pollicipes pollicipes]|uniref:uncharacterized protein LOC119110112 n=1 Tax=Pollicipes pollicipes TaxID=41117 RepID=UPI001884FFED|nr:uncharacterized protein LOC119110112 [Pollicipes pollicipes]